MRVLVTGAAGFIGFHTAKALLARGDEVVGIDNLNPYYDPALKQARLAGLVGQPGFTFREIDIADLAALGRLFEDVKPHRVVHLAAQAGVRYSLSHPEAYAAANLTGFLAILEGCRRTQVEHLVYASSSSVYGSNTRQPFSVRHSVDHPVSLYAATKKANELMAHSYSHLYRLPTTGLRFFTVYGPWGRPDMSPYIFTRKILAGEPIEVFNHGNHARDFTYIDDIVEGVVRTLDKVAVPDPNWSSDAPDPSTSNAPWRVYNIGNSQPTPLLDFIATIERACGREAAKILLPMQPGDVEATSADTAALERDVGFRPDTPLATGIERFVAWYRNYHGV
jgi:UDP-glucuronate 4-epimerase